MKGNKNYFEDKNPDSYKLFLYFTQLYLKVFIKLVLIQYGRVTKVQFHVADGHLVSVSKGFQRASGRVLQLKRHILSNPLHEMEHVIIIIVNITPMTFTSRQTNVLEDRVPAQIEKDLKLQNNFPILHSGKTSW